MILIQDIGILLLIILLFYGYYVIEADYNKGYKWYIPLGSAIIVWLYLEADFFEHQVIFRVAKC